MADEADTTPDGGETAPDNKGEGPKDTFTPITSQEDFDEAIKSRIARERAKFDGFDEYKAAADELAKIRDGEKTELQKLTEQLQEQTARADKAERDSLVASVAAAKGVPTATLTGSTREELEASADALIAWRDQNAPQKPKPNKPLKSGTTGTDSPDRDPKAAAAEALRLMRSGG